MVNEAEVIYTDLLTSSGVIHILTKVIPVPVNRCDDWRQSRYLVCCYCIQHETELPVNDIFAKYPILR